MLKKIKSKTKNRIKIRPQSKIGIIHFIGALVLIGISLFVYLLFKPKKVQIAEVGYGSAQTGYRVGVNYNSTSPNFDKDSFILNYHKAEVRNLVKSQLKSIADSGASYVNTRLWFTDASQRFPNATWRLGFPPTQQELDNIKLYTQDVSQVIKPNGEPLDLYLTMLWLGCGDYISGHKDFCQYDWSTYREKAKGVISQLFATVGGLKRSDGRNAVNTMYMDGEVDLINKPNTDKWLKEVYPHFLSLSNQYQIKPSLYFLPDTMSSSLELNNNDRVHATLNYMSANNLYIPERIDLSLYAQKINGSYSPAVNKIVADLAKKYPGKSVGVAEAGYPRDESERKLYGQAYYGFYKQTGNPVEIAFWTTPNSADHQAFASFPFDVKSFLPDGGVTPAPTPTSYYMDVPSTYPHYQGIESMREIGAMSGCSVNPNKFCPDGLINRAQAAYILLKVSKGPTYTPPSPPVQKFTDVPSTHLFYPWVDAFSSLGITSGCGGQKYCPDQALNRGQLAVFILRSKNGSNYVPPAARGIFSDVPKSHPYAGWIEELKNLNITSGCAADKFCPDKVVTRAEMATLMLRAFGER